METQKINLSLANVPRAKKGKENFMRLIPLKRGDTFALNADITNADGEVVNYLASQIKSQIRTKNDILVASLTVQSTETPGRYVLMAAETSTWPIGVLEMDIEVNNGEAIMSSPTIEVPVIKDITRDE